MGTYLLAWNEKDWPQDRWDEVLKRYRDDGHVERAWSCGNRKKIYDNDRVYFMKRGKGQRGLFASGYVRGEVYEDDHFNDEAAREGERSNYVNVQMDYLVDPRVKVVISRDELLSSTLQDGPWDQQGGGRQIPPPIVEQLGKLWASRTGGSGIPYPDDVVDGEEHTEGACKEILVNAYERDPAARQKCIDHHGLACHVCGFNFEYEYGDIGKGYIHVHHLKPLSEIGEEYVVDPINDLRPVCPNCHAMLHSKSPPHEFDELKRRWALYGGNH